MRYIPLDVIFSWPVPNYDNPVTRGSGLVVVNAILITLTVVSVTLRIYTRIAVNGWFGADDWAIITALLFAIGLTACVMLANISYGWDRHVWDIRPQYINKSYQIAFATKIVFVLAAMFTRMSLMFFYHRLVKDSGLRMFRIVIHASQVFSALVGTSLVLLTVFQCNPIRAFWVFPSIDGAKCIDEGQTTLGGGVVNIIADLWTAILPIPMIARLQMTTGRRIGVSFLLGLGFLVVIAGILRSYYVWVSLVDSYDTTWYCYPLWICAAIEIDLAVICACVPSFRLLLAILSGRYLPSVRHTFGTLTGSRSRGGQSSNPSFRNCSKLGGLFQNQSQSDRATTVDDDQDKGVVWSNPYAGGSTQTYDSSQVPLVSMPVQAFDSMQLRGPSSTQTTITHHRASHSNDYDEADITSSVSVPSSGDSDRTQRVPARSGDILVETGIHVTSHCAGSGTTNVLDEYAERQRAQTIGLHKKLTSLVEARITRTGTR